MFICNVLNDLESGSWIGFHGNGVRFSASSHAGEKQVREEERVDVLSHESQHTLLNVKHHMSGSVDDERENTNPSSTGLPLNVQRITGTG